METSDNARIAPRRRTIASAAMPQGNCPRPTTTCWAEVSAPTSTLVRSIPT